jgi:putative endopeptidase
MRLAGISVMLLGLAAAGAAQQARHGVDLAAIDTHVNPCNDFYQYACGNWIASHPIPADQSNWGTFGEVAQRDHIELRKILTAAENAKAADPVTTKVGNFYAACMNTAALNRLGAAPLQPELRRIAAIDSQATFAAEIGRMHAAGEAALFRFGSGPDAKDSNNVIAQAGQGGADLPRDYYVKNTPHNRAILAAYRAHIARIFELLGDPASRALAEAATVVRIETAFARASLSNVQLRNPNARYHIMSLAQFRSMTPAFDWSAYLATVHAPAFTTLNVGEPGFFRALNTELTTVSLDDWKTYLRWQVAHAGAPALSHAFVQADFDFFSYTLRGTRVNQPRWYRCSAAADRGLGEDVGQLYVKAAFGGNAKQKALLMVHQLEAALGHDIQGLTWMSQPTKQQALLKLDKISNMIGYPSHWRDYSALVIRRGDYYGNERRVAAFNWARAMHDLGRPFNRTRFNMTPPTVNANYTPDRNTITFPAGILQPPFYDPQRDLASNFGGIGVVIGHEMTHGFDDEGRHFDGQGNLHDWWTSADSKAFDLRARCLIDQYSRYSPVAGVHLNGRLTLGENTADNGGARIAYMAMEAALTPAQRGKIDGYTPEQRFFLAFARVFCENVRPRSARASVKTDPHSPGKFRVLGVVTNMPEFAQAFHCGPHDAMSAGPQSCRVW